MKDDELRNFQEVDLALQELKKQPGWDALVEYNNLRMRSDKSRILNGNFDSLDEYKHVTGWLRGIHDVLDTPKIVNDIVSNEIARRREAAAAEG